MTSTGLSIESHMTARALADSFRKFSVRAATVALAWQVGEHVHMGR
jgi:hypothetical protein